MKTTRIHRTLRFFPPVSPMQRLRKFYRGASDPYAARVALTIGALWIIAVIIWMSGIFSADIEEELARTRGVPVPSADQLGRLFSGRDAPGLPRSPRATADEAPPSRQNEEHP